MFCKIRHRPILIMSALSVAILNFLSCTFAHKRAARLYAATQQQGCIYDAIIVPGIPFDGVRWDSTMRGRVLWSYHLYKNGIARNIIYSGGAVYTRYYESKIMALYALALGIPVEHIFCDTLAEHSTENVFYAYQIAKSHGFKSIALATDPGQSALLQSFTRKRFDSPIAHIPFLVDTLRQYNHLQPDIDPSTAIKPDFIAITERQGRWERLKGTLGKYIPWPDERKRADSL
jgi:hypothetical protein